MTHYDDQTPYLVQGRILNYVLRHVEALLRDRQISDRTAFARPSICLVRNDSGGDRERYEILGSGEALIGRDENQAQWEMTNLHAGVVLSRPAHVGDCVVLLEPAPADAIVRAATVGDTVPAMVLRKFAHHTHCDVVAGEHGYLESCLWGSHRMKDVPLASEASESASEEGSEEGPEYVPEWGKVILGCQPSRGPWKGIALETIHAYSHGRVRVVVGTTPTSEVVDCYLDHMSGGESVAAGSEVFFCRFVEEDRYVITEAPCDEGSNSWSESADSFE